MTEIQKLLIDDEFRELIRPLLKDEYLTLESNLLADGRRDPITIWNGVIVDGHNRYEICTRHNIPFSIVTHDFSSREEAILKVIGNQTLSLHDLSVRKTQFIFITQRQNYFPNIHIRLSLLVPTVFLIGYQFF